MEVIPVRAGIHGINQKFIKWGRFFVNRYSRKSIYYANMEGEIIDEWNNNVTVSICISTTVPSRHRNEDKIQKKSFQKGD